jgi:hypothetical protein
LHDPVDGTYFGDVEEVHVFELTRLPAIPDGTSRHALTTVLKRANWKAFSKVYIRAYNKTDLRQRPWLDFYMAHLSAYG